MASFDVSADVNLKEIWGNLDPDIYRHKKTIERCITLSPTFMYCMIPHFSIFYSHFFHMPRKVTKTISVAKLVLSSIQLIHSFEVNIMICQPENSDVHRGETEVDITS